MKIRISNNRSILSRAFSRVVSIVSNFIWGRRFGKFGPHSRIGKPLLLTGQDAVHVGRNVDIWVMARIEAFKSSPNDILIQIGDGTVIQPFVHIAAAYSVKIGKDCLFASNVYISDHDHDWSDPYTPTIRTPDLIVAPVKIGDGVWLGERVTVLKGVSIGEGSVVGAGSVVTKDLPPRSIAAGVPATIRRQWNEDLGEWEKL